MAYDDDFVDGGDVGMHPTRGMGSLEPKLHGREWNERDVFDTGERNARWLKSLFEHSDYASGRRVRLYIPEGRYYVGLPDTPVASSEQAADLLVPAHFTLVFGPKATLVPLAYPDDLVRLRTLRGAAWIEARRMDLPPGEHLKVRIEVQGLIEAELDKIFDPFLEDDRNTLGQPSTEVPTRRAGTVFFARDNLRAVYPEWWGAVPKRSDSRTLEEGTELTEAEIRRTTVAVQSCIDAVLHHRIRVPRSSFVRDAGGNLVPTGSRPSTEVVFANDYVIDRPIRLGMTLQQARVATGQQPASDESPFHRIGLSIRGACGPATRRNGAALLQASRTFPSAAEGVLPEALPPATLADPTPVLFGDSYSLMVVRTLAPVSIDNVVFDAAERAERCLTVMTFTSTHHHQLEGCTFRNATHAQLYIGGEVPEPSENVSGVGDVIDVRARYFSGGQDPGDMRVTRCHFETGTGPGKELRHPPYRKLNPVTGRWRHGVIYRAEPGLGTEFHGCVFRGPGSPMFLAIGGRLSFQDCAFDTDLVRNNPQPSSAQRAPEARLRWWNGTDLHLAAGFGEILWINGAPPPRDGNNRPQIQPVFGTMFTARNVVSCSRQFLTTHPDITGVRAEASWSFATVTILHLRHRSRHDDPVPRPAIYWGAPRINNCVLALEGCSFETVAPAELPGYTNPRGAVFISPMETPRDPAPVLVLASRRAGGAELLCSTVAMIPNVMRVAG